MPRYFFDIQDGMELHRDDYGVDCADRDDIRKTAMRSLPDVAREERAADHARTFTVIARDEDGRTVFFNQLTLTGTWVAETI